MPLIAGAIGALVAALAGFFVEYIGKRFAIIAAVVLVISGFVVGFFAAVVGIIDGIAMVAPPGLTVALGWVVPDNVPLLVSTLFTARLMRWAYEWNVKIIQFRLF